MPHSSSWRSAKCKLSGLRNFFPVSTEAAVHPHKICVGHHILLLKSQDFGVCLSEKSLSVAHDGDPISAEQHSSTPGRTFGRTLPNIFWE